MSVPAYPSPSEAVREEGTLRSRDGTRLHWERYAPRAPRATAAVLPGGGDHAGRYPALTRALVEAGVEVALLDFRGHGRSAGRRWHVGRFAEYCEDLDAFVDELRGRIAGRRLFAVAHSMGALVAATWALLPGREAAGFVFSSPWFKPAVDPPRLKVAVGRAVGKVIPWLPVATGLRPSDLTSDEAMQDWTDRDPLYGRSTTPRWFEEATRAQAQVLARAKEFRHPVLVLAGGADAVADAATAELFADQAGSADKAFKLYPGFKHELFNERERERPVAEVVAWIVARS